MKSAALKITASKTTALKKHLMSLLIILPLILTACATGAKSDQLAPEWFKELEESEDETCYLVKISAFGSSEVEASEKVVNELYERVMELSGKGDLFSDPEDQEEMKNWLRSLIETEEPIEKLVYLQRQEWVSDDESSYYYGAFCIYKNLAEMLNDYLMETYYSNDIVLNAFLSAADGFEAEGKSYSAAEEYLNAALYVKQQSHPMSLSIAQFYVDKAASLLAGIIITGVQAPERALANVMIEVPFQILCSSEDAVVTDVEFLVLYEGRNRAGGKANFERRLVSNPFGIVDFFHPFLPFSGTSTVRFTPGSRDFHSGVLALNAEGLDMSAINAWEVESTLKYDISVESVSRKLPMGIVILHTDIAGAALKNNESSLGLAEALSLDGYSVEVMTLDPGEVRKVDEPAFLRDLRAAFKDDYVRVIFGTVEIQDFESIDDSYRVKTGGTLKAVDVKSGEILMTLELDKSVESRNNTLAVTASFRELGKAFAQEIITGLE